MTTFSTVRFAAVALVAAFAIASSVRAELPSFEGLAQAVSTARSSVIRPEAPDVTWEFEDDGAKTVTRGGYFHPRLDTPAFGNFATRRPGSRKWSGGTCYGVNHLTVVWFQTFVVPIFREALDWGFEVRDKLGVKGPVTFENLPRHRLHAYSSAPQRKSALQHEAIKFHWDQLYLMPFGHVGAEQLFSQIVGDLGNRDSQLSMIGIHDAAKTAGHSLLVYRVEEGFARASNGRRTSARKVCFYDPNFPVAGNSQTEMYLLYFPAAKKWAINPKWQALYGSLKWQQGAFLKAGQLKFGDINPIVSRWAREVFNGLQGNAHAKDEISAD